MVTPSEYILNRRTKTCKDIITYQEILEATGRTELRDVDFSHLDLRNTDFQGADLEGANLRSADLVYVNLQGAILRSADLRGADLWKANLRNTDLRWADLIDVDGVLQIHGHPSGRVILYPTPDGWRLSIGCWTGSFKKLKKLVAGEEWPEAVGEDIVYRRKWFEPTFELIRLHIEYYKALPDDIANHWDVNVVNKPQGTQVNIPF